MTTETISITAGKTVGALALQFPLASQVFEHFGIDYCCGGKSPLFEASSKAGITVEEVIQALEKTEQFNAARTNPLDWREKSLADLIQHIVATHHVYTRDQISRLSKLIEKVHSVHGQNHPELSRVQSLFQELAQELGPHMLKEEQILFPYIARLEATQEGTSSLPYACFGTVVNPIRVMGVEHDQAGTVLSELRNVTCNYTPPSDACASYETLYTGLKEFEQDLHQHIHLENNLLFPRAVEHEKRWMNRF